MVWLMRGKWVSLLKARLGKLQAWQLLMGLAFIAGMLSSMLAAMLPVYYFYLKVFLILVLGALYLPCCVILLFLHFSRAKKAYVLAPHLMVRRDGWCFLLWFWLHNLSWALAGTVLELGLLLFYGPTELVVLFNAGLQSMVIFALMGMLPGPRPTTLGLLWRYDASATSSWLDNVGSALALRSRYREGLRQDASRELPVLVDIHRVLDLVSIGGAERKVALWEEGLGGFGRELRLRARAMAPLFVGGSSLALLLLFLLPGLRLIPPFEPGVAGSALELYLPLGVKQVVVKLEQERKQSPGADLLSGASGRESGQAWQGSEASDRSSDDSGLSEDPSWERGADEGDWREAEAWKREAERHADVRQEPDSDRAALDHPMGRDVSGADDRSAAGDNRSLGQGADGNKSSNQVGSTGGQGQGQDALGNQQGAASQRGSQGQQAGGSQAGGQKAGGSQGRQAGGSQAGGQKAGGSQSRQAGGSQAGGQKAGGSQGRQAGGSQAGGQKAGGSQGRQAGGSQAGGQKAGGSQGQQAGGSQAGGQKAGGSQGQQAGGSQAGGQKAGGSQGRQAGGSQAGGQKAGGSQGRQAGGSQAGGQKAGGSQGRQAGGSQAGGQKAGGSQGQQAGGSQAGVQQAGANSQAAGGQGQGKGQTGQSGQSNAQSQSGAGSGSGGGQPGSRSTRDQGDSRASNRSGGSRRAGKTDPVTGDPPPASGGSGSGSPGAMPPGGKGMVTVAMPPLQPSGDAPLTRAGKKRNTDATVSPVGMAVDDGDIAAPTSVKDNTGGQSNNQSKATQHLPNWIITLYKKQNDERDQHE